MAEKRLHGSARTNRYMRQAIKLSTGSIQSVAKEFGINPKTVSKWRRRDSVEDAPMGQQRKRSRALASMDEGLVVLFRDRTKLSLDQCLQHLRSIIPHLTRSTLYRCFLRHGVNLVDKTGYVTDDRELSKLMLEDYEKFVGYLARLEKKAISYENQREDELWSAARAKLRGGHRRILVSRAVGLMARLVGHRRDAKGGDRRLRSSSGSSRG